MEPLEDSVQRSVFSVQESAGDADRHKRVMARSEATWPSVSPSEAEDGAAGDAGDADRHTSDAALVRDDSPWGVGRGSNGGPPGSPWPGPYGGRGGRGQTLPNLIWQMRRKAGLLSSSSR